MYWRSKIVKDSRNGNYNKQACHGSRPDAQSRSFFSGSVPAQDFSSKSHTCRGNVDISGAVGRGSGVDYPLRGILWEGRPRGLSFTVITRARGRDFTLTDLLLPFSPEMLLPFDWLHRWMTFFEDSDETTSSETCRLWFNSIETHLLLPAK